MRRYWLQWLTLAMLAVMLVTLTGCSSVKYIPVTEYRDRYVSKTDSFIKTDSVYLHDSVTVFAKGDTVYISKIRFKDRFKIVYHTKTSRPTWARGLKHHSIIKGKVIKRSRPTWARGLKPFAL